MGEEMEGRERDAEPRRLRSRGRFGAQPSPPP
nr:MAG TPA: hypothetical protein [Caudoviricetes sp.]